MALNNLNLMNTELKRESPVGSSERVRRQCCGNCESFEEGKFPRMSEEIQGFCHYHQEDVSAHLKACFAFEAKEQKPPNDQKLSRPEPAALVNQKPHSPIRDANEGLAPALC